MRFTIDGSDELERRLEGLCGDVAERVRGVIPARKLEGIVLGGGYGRGEGGVLRTQKGDLLYNDMEFYVFLRGSRLWNVRRYQAALNELCERVSGQAGLHVEIKIESLSRFSRAPVSMVTY